MPAVVARPWRPRRWREQRVGAGTAARGAARGAAIRVPAHLQLRQHARTPRGGGGAGGGAGGLAVRHGELGRGGRRSISKPLRTNARIVVISAIAASCTSAHD